jgi:hypothetical protein
LHFYPPQVEFPAKRSDNGVIMSKKRTAKSYRTPVDYFSNYYELPKQWMGTDEDLVIGDALLTLFTPFIESLIKDELSVKTITNHMGNLSVLGGEIIWCLNGVDEKKRNLTPRELLLEYICDDGGPLVHHWNPNDRAEEAHLKSFDATCRKLYRFIAVMPSN